MSTFGWIPWESRSSEQNKVVYDCVSKMPAFAIVGRSRSRKAEKAFLWETWKDPRVLSATGGKVYSGNHQLSGCCVGAGGGNALFSLSAVEVVRLGMPYQALVPFWLLPYGMSRKLLGEHGPGEGSTGTTFAKALTQFGDLPANTPGLPEFHDSDGLVWGKEAEMKWSDGEAIGEKWLALARRNLVKTTSPIRSADDAREAIVNGYPFGFCGNWGGKMECDTRGTPPVLLNTRQGNWNHQQSCHGWWDHPTLGEIFYILNQWGLRAHGQDPAGGPPGGYWILRPDMEYQARNGECIAYSQFMGFPAPDWEIPWLF